MSNVIQIESMRITRDSRLFRPKECAHKQLTLDNQGDIVMCDDCGKQVSAYWALCMLAEEYSKAAAKLTARAERQIEVEKKTLHLKAAQKVEMAWRSRTMAPTCPHCSEAIYPTDGFGSAMINKEIADRRRASKVKP